MNQYSAYSLLSMLNGNNNSANNTTPQPGYPYSNNQPPGFNNPGFNRNPLSFQQGYNDKKGPYFDYGNKNRPYNGWGQKTDPESNVDEVVADHSFTVLDHYNCDLNLVIDLDGYGAFPMTEPEGFCFCWAGARSTYGVTRGKVFFEVHIIENLPVVYGDNHNEVDPHVVRLGWSVDSSCFQLGESENSFGYGGTGKFSVALKFSDYGERFGVGDVIGSLLDLQSHPPTISFTKNGHWFGTAYTLHNYPVGVKSKALFPHILTKNCRFKVNFGQTDAWFAPPPGFVYIDHVPLDDRVRGLTGPSKKAECEMNMIVGLPGVGKTTLGIKKQRENIEKRYNIIGTDTLIDKMRVMGLPRKRNYHGRWDVLIDKASKCLNKLFQVASRRKRNYILDQTNVYASARRNKMKNFQGFQRIAWVLVPEDDEFERRSVKRTVEDGKVVPVAAVLEMKANFKLPVEGVDPFDKIEFIELHRDKAAVLVDKYMKEGIEKRPPREMVFRYDKKYQQNTMPSPVCRAQSSQNKAPDSFAAAMAVVKAAISYPVVKLEPDIVKIEPGLPADQGSLTASVATPSKPDLYIVPVYSTPTPTLPTTTTPAAAAAATATVKTENVSTSSADSKMSTDNQRKEKETNKGNSNDVAANSGSSSSTTGRKTGYREESRRRDRRDEHRHRSRSRSRSRRRSSSHYSDKSRYDSRHGSEKDMRDRHHSDRDRYRERGHDRDRHRGHHRSDSHGRRRGSDGRNRDRRDDRDGSSHSDSKYSESQNSKKPAPEVKPASPSNYQSPQKPGDTGSLESKWSHSSSVSDSTRQQCPSSESNYQSSGIASRQVASPFDSVGKQDKSDFTDLFGRQDVDYRMPTSTCSSWQSPSQSQPSESSSYGQSRVSEQLPFSRSVPPPQPQIPVPGSTYPQHPPPAYSEVQGPNEFNNPNYQKYPASSSYLERDGRFSSTNPGYAPMTYGEHSTPALDNSGNYLPGKEDGKNFNQSSPGVTHQSKTLENRYGYPSADGMRQEDLDTRTGYTPLKVSSGSVASHLANSQLTASLYPPYTPSKPINPSSEVNAVDYQSGNDSDLRSGVSSRNENETMMPNKDNNNGLNTSVSGMKSLFSSMPKSVSVSSSNNNNNYANNSYASEGAPPRAEPFQQSIHVQLPANINRDNSYSFGNQSGAAYKNDYNSFQRWGGQGQGGGVSSFPVEVRTFPAMMQNAHPQYPLQQAQWSERNSMDPRMAPLPPGNFGMGFPPNFPDYSSYQNMPYDMVRRYLF